MPEGPEFDARIEQRAGYIVLVVRGELDMDSAPPLRALLASPDAQAATVVLDLRAVSFVDSSGLSVIVGEHQRAKSHGYRFMVSIAGARQVERLFELCGLTGTVATVDDPDALPVA
jgi:anti-sigma B factor antagonist